MTRVGFGVTTAGAALAALLAGPNVADGAGGPRTVVVTGANSGIGLDAATKLVRSKSAMSAPAVVREPIYVGIVER